MKEHLDKHERCKNCYHLSSCDAWVRHGTTLYDDYEYSVEDCPYYIPAADVDEVRHGFWIDTDRFDSFKTPIYQCSKCWKEVADNYIKYHKYCLHCGTEMDGE